MNDLPTHSEEAELGELGVRLVEAAIHDELKWIFRVKRKLDVGVDGEIELVNADREATGRLIAAQVKCGDSYLSKRSRDGIWYHGEISHLNYWLGHSLAVIIIICDPHNRHCYWAEVSAATVVRLRKGWKLKVLYRNRLNADATWQLEELANRLQLQDYLEPAVRNWLYEKYYLRIEICSMFELPRDYHWFQFLAKIDSDMVMMHYLYARYGQFSLEDLADVLKYKDYNQRDYGCEKLVLCLIAHHQSAFEYAPDFAATLVKATDVQVIRMLVATQPFFTVHELNEKGEMIDEYIRGEPQTYSSWK
jgi:hypothetical protein